MGVALAGVVEDHVEDHADPGRAQGCGGGAELGDAAGAEAGVGGEERDGVVAPGVGEAERRQVTLVDPRGDRHQLDRIDAETGQVRDDRRLGEGGNSAAQGWGDVGVQAREAADVQLVDQAARAEDRWQRGGGRRKGSDDRPRHPGGAVAGGLAGGGEAGVPVEGAIERHRVGVDEELGGVEPEADRGGVRAVGAQAVARTRGKAGDEDGVDAARVAVEGDAVGFDPGAGIEEAGPDPLGGAGPDGEAGAVRAGGGAESGGNAGQGQALRGISNAEISKSVLKQRYAWLMRDERAVSRVRVAPAAVRWGKRRPRGADPPARPALGPRRAARGASWRHKERAGARESLWWARACSRAPAGRSPPPHPRHCLSVPIGRFGAGWRRWRRAAALRQRRGDGSQHCRPEGAAGEVDRPS